MNAPPQITARVRWLLLLLFIPFVGALGLLHLIERRGLASIIAHETEEQGYHLDAAISRAGLALQFFTETYRRRTPFTRPRETLRTATPESVLQRGLRTLGLDAAWIIENDGRGRLATTAEPDAEGIFSKPPVSAPQLRALGTSAVTYFHERGGAIYRVRGQRLLSDPTEPGEAPGWIFAAVRWDNRSATSPGVRATGRIDLLPPALAGQPVSPDFPVRVDRLLRDLDGRPVGLLRLEFRPEEVDTAEFTDQLELTTLAAYGVVSLGVLTLCLYRWVIVPAGILRQSLAERSTDRLRPLFAQGGYVAESAQLLHQLFETQQKLEQTLADRARIGRELHDGAIQTLYAAGMGLAAAREAVRSQPAEAERLLEDTRTELNATIIELRAFLAGIETPAVELRSFSEAVRSMTGIIEHEKSVRIVPEIDDQAAARLTPGEQMQLLQVVREAVSNAVRHSGARTITISLALAGADVVLEVRDDGRGFEPGRTADGGGHGLANFEARARELGGTVKVLSSLHAGTAVRLTLSSS